MRVLLSNVTEDPDHREDEFVCDVCGRVFRSEDELDDHVHDEGQLY